jgi:hypothetical protein
MKNTIAFTFQFLAILGAINLLILFWTIAAVAVGDPNVQHIPFWDAQILFIVSLF